MRVDASTPPRRGASSIGFASIAIASALLVGALVAGCRTAGGAGKVTMAPPPALQPSIASAEAAEISSLPDGPAKVLVTERCLLCHGAGLISNQRKDAAAWGRTVTQMRTWGTPIQDEDQTALVAYLTQHFGPNAARR